MTPWEIKGREFVNCNCAYGCPCQFNALPTYGNCEAVGVIAIDEGHFGDVGLDGLKLGFIFQWPGAVHEGRGKCQPIVDARADERQREALLRLASGEDSDPGATSFNVYASTMTEVFEPIVADIEFDVDVERRTGRIHVDGVAEVEGGPIRNPITGDVHRARIDLPRGFEYEVAEIGSASCRTWGKIKLENKDSYGQFAHLHMNNHGPVRSARAAPLTA